MKKTMSILFLLASIGLFTMSPSLSYGETFSYSDNFNDGTIDSTFWSVSGDGISETGGYLNLSRNNPIDSISSINSYSGLFDISFDFTLNNITWNDMFHGITVENSTTLDGFSFGFTKYGNFYSTQQSSTSFDFSYGSSFSTGTTYSIQLL